MCSPTVSLHYDFSGPVDNIYASLITSLAISRRFGFMRLWQDRAEFGRAGEDSSGVRRVRQGNQAARGHERNPALVEQLHALRTDIRDRRSGEIVEVKVEAEMTKREEPRASTPRRILHLSDLHRCTHAPSA